ncbi:MAG: polysaccharide deacetylase family protein, partial [Oscillospiraceae bacterium]|nr:polysaccharide deacetylase family protein [Oscillospiraceae bacterium]
WCDRYPEYVKKFYDAGHEIENHSDKHPHVLGANVNDLIADTRECSRKIKMLTGEEPTLYRAPYGEFDDSLITTLDGMGMQVIQWDVDSVDWKKPSAADIKKKVLKGVKPGSILLFHNDLANTTEALPEILSNLKSQGYKFVTVKDLIYKDNYTIDANGKQIPTSEGAVKISDEKLEEVMAQYADVFSALGLSEDQIAQAKAALKSGDLTSLPKELQPLAEEVMAKVTENSSNTSNTSGGANSSPNLDAEPSTSDTTEK